MKEKGNSPEELIKMETINSSKNRVMIIMMQDIVNKETIKKDSWEIKNAISEINNTLKE